MSNKNRANIIFLSGLILFSAYICNGQAFSNASPAQDPISSFDADVKYVDVFDEDLIKVLTVYSILNNVPIKDIPIDEVKKVLAAVKAAGLSNKTRSMNFPNEIVVSNKTSSSVVQKVLITLACLAVIGACGAYIYKEYERQRREHEEYERREAFKQAAYATAQEIGNDLGQLGNKFKQGCSDAWDSVSGWWNSEKKRASESTYACRWSTQ